MPKRPDPSSIVLIGDALASEDPVNFLQTYMAPLVLALPNDSCLSILSVQAQNLFLTDQFSREILGNGFSGIFYNSVGYHSCEIVCALEELGAKISADLLRSTFDYFPDSKPSVDRFARVAAAESLGESFEEQLELTSSAFYSQVATHPGEKRSESLWELSLIYMNKHKLVNVLAKT